MDYVLCNSDLSQYQESISGSASHYASPTSQLSYTTSPSTSSSEGSPRSSFAGSPSRAFQSASPSQYDIDDCDADQQQYGDLNSLYAVPQPLRYADEMNLRDSAYAGSSEMDGVNCYQNGNVALGDQMLTDEYELVDDQEIQLSGISSRDHGMTSPGYHQYGAGLEDDALMLVAGANGTPGGYYVS
jgi:hypothetical protein